MTKEQELALSAEIAEKWMKWHKELPKFSVWWANATGDLIMPVSDFNPAANPADCALVKAEARHRHMNWEAGYLDGWDNPHYTRFHWQRIWRSTISEEHAFCLAVKASMEGK